MSELLNKKYKIELEVLTPLHIGAGQEKEWMKGADYINDKGNIYILNHRKIAQKLSAGELTSFLLNKDDQGLKKKLGADLKEVSDNVFKVPVDSDNDIKTFVKNGLSNKPIVPGSSIKGAIRSILLNYFIENSKTIDRKDRRFEEKIFGSANKGDEFMRFIKIADAQFENTELVNTKIFNLYGTAPNLNGGWKHEFRGGTTNNFRSKGFNTIYETIQPKETGELSIALSDKGFDNFYKESSPEKKSNILHKEPSQKLFEIINKHTKEYIQKQIAFFEKYSNNETPKIIERLRSVLNEIPDDNSACILKMSAGSGFHSITGDWQFDDFSIDGVKTGKGPSRGQLHRQDSAKSRKIAIDNDNFYLMGFVKLSVVSDELIAQREAEKQAKLELKRKEEAERLAKEKAEQERIEAEKQAKLDAERKAEKERILKEKAEQEERERIIREKAEQELRKQEANKAKREELANSGLIILNEIEEYNKGKYIIKEYKKINKTIDSSQFQFIKEFVKKCYGQGKTSDWKNIKRGNWKEIKSWTNEDVVKELFKELTK